MSKDSNMKQRVLRLLNPLATVSYFFWFESHRWIFLLITQIFQVHGKIHFNLTEIRLRAICSSFIQLIDKFLKFVINFFHHELWSTSNVSGLLWNENQTSSNRSISRSLGALDFPHLRTFIGREIERNEDYLSSNWFPSICQIYQTGQVAGITQTPEKLDRFYNSVNTLISNQVH